MRCIIDAACVGEYSKRVGAPIMRVVPSRQYLSAGLVALALATVSGWCAFEWVPAAIPAFLLLLSSALLMFLALRPPIEIHEKHLAIGNRMVLWAEIRRVDRSGWVSPPVPLRRTESS